LCAPAGFPSAHTGHLLSPPARPKSRVTFITTTRGEPFSPPSFTNWFREQCREAGLQLGLSVHGLRKAVCCRLAEAGCSEKQIAAITGHKTLRMLQHYTEAADQKRLARSAIEHLGNESVAHRKNRYARQSNNPLKSQDQNLPVPILSGSK
jgi:integrase